MLFVTLLFILVQLAVAIAAPVRFVYLSFWLPTMPYTWNWDAQLVFATPLGPELPGGRLSDFRSFSFGVRGIWRTASGEAARIADAVDIWQILSTPGVFETTSSDQLLADPTKAPREAKNSGRFDLWDKRADPVFKTPRDIGSGIRSLDRPKIISTDLRTIRHAWRRRAFRYVRLLWKVGVTGLPLFVAILAYLAE